MTWEGLKSRRSGQTPSIFIEMASDTNQYLGSASFGPIGAWNDLSQGKGQTIEYLQESVSSTNFVLAAWLGLKVMKIRVENSEQTPSNFIGIASDSKPAS